MDTYQYKYGDRPLEGYTIQRAAGRGGFGEVYYAISDSGRQVALKAVQSYEQIELRGISQCMNLKSPHLVTIFDVKYNDQGRPFVIMEYVSGPSLSDLLRESPGGLGTQKAAFFLREIAKGLSFLHECGIVHRDLKPSNIFYENGYVKIGDYGLTKAISTSHHVSHTITVGTVHYMAPEIGAGRYDRSIDIYALGVLLYEMLTGQVPFLGSSPAEILMKHMTAAPDLSNIEEPFARVIRRALAKDPAERYQGVQEMVEDVFGTEYVRNSVSQFAPEELSVIAEHIAQKVHGARPQGQAHRPAPGGADSDFSKEIGKKAELFAKKAEVLGKQVAERFKTVKERAQQAGRNRARIEDPLSLRQRHKLAMIAMAATALGAGFICGHNDDAKLKVALVVFLMIGLASRIVTRSLQQWWGALDQERKGLGKVGTSFFAAFLAVLVGTVVANSLGVMSDISIHHGFPWPMRGFMRFGPFGGWFKSMLALALPMLLVDWRKVSDPQRPKRIVLGWPILIGLAGLVSGGFFGLHPIVTASTLAGILLVVQTKSPFGRTTVSTPVAAAPELKRFPAKASPMGSPNSAVIRPLPAYARPLWLAGWLVSLGFGLFWLIMSGVEMHGDEQAVAIAVGIDSLLLSVFCFIMIFRGAFTGWYRYLIRPGLLLACVLTVVTASVLLGNANMAHDEEGIALFFIVFPAILFFAVLFVPARLFGAPEINPAEPLPPPARKKEMPSGPVSPASRLTALILALVPAVPVLPICGLHRFYVGKIGTGILWLFTFGLAGIGQFIDVILIIAGGFRDKNELPLTVWHHDDETASVAAPPQAAAAQTPAAAVHGEQAMPAVEPPKPQQVNYRPPSWPSYASSGSVYQPFDPVGGLLAAVGHILVLAAMLIGLAIGLHLPAVVAAGWPNPEIAQNLNQVFGYTGWPALLENAGFITIVVLLALATVLIMIGRRKSGPVHMLRAVAGLVGFFWAIQLFRSEVVSYDYVQGIIDQIQMNQVGPALEKLFGVFSQEEAIVAGVIFLVSALIMAWPPRRRTPVFAAMPNQGVVL